MNNQILLHNVLRALETLLDDVKSNTSDNSTETTLALIKTAIDSIESSLDVNLSTIATEATLSGQAADIALIESKLNTLGQKLSAASTPVVLSTEQETILSNILTEISTISGDFATETTLNALLTAFNAEDFATETTSALINSNVQLGNITLNNLLTAFNAEDFSSETTQLLVKTVLDLINAKLVDGNDIGDVTVNNTNLSPVPVSDAGGSLTVDGSVTVSATDLDIRDLDSASDSVEVLQPTHDDLNLNANIQVGDTDVSGANPVPVSGTVTVNQPVSIDDNGGSITIDNTNLDTALATGTRTHNTVSSTGVGSVPAGSFCGSVLNVGNSSGTWNGVALPAGVSIPWARVGVRDTYNAINYDATGTTFIIEYTT